MPMMHVEITTGMQWLCPVMIVLSMEEYALPTAGEEVSQHACNHFSLADGDGILKIYHCLLPVCAPASAKLCQDVSLAYCKQMSGVCSGSTGKNGFELPCLCCTGK